MVAAEIPGNPGGTEVVGETQVDDLLLDRRRCSQRVVLRIRPAVDETRLPLALVGVQPVVVGLARDSKVPACLGHIAALPRVVRTFILRLMSLWASVTGILRL